jgi:hypothetical protein
LSLGQGSQCKYTRYKAISNTRHAKAKCIGGGRECKNPHPLSSMHLFKLPPRCSAEPLPPGTLCQDTAAQDSTALRCSAPCQAVAAEVLCTTGHTAQNALHPSGFAAGALIRERRWHADRLRRHHEPPRLPGSQHRRSTRSHAVDVSVLH